MKEPTVTKAVIIDFFQKNLKPWISIYIYISLSLSLSENQVFMTSIMSLRTGMITAGGLFLCMITARALVITQALNDIIMDTNLFPVQCLGACGSGAGHNI